MEPHLEALRLLRRKTDLENAMRRPGGIRVTEERELLQLRHALSSTSALQSQGGDGLADESEGVAARTCAVNPGA